MRVLHFRQVAWLGVFLIACAGAHGGNTSSEPAGKWYSECRQLYYNLPVQISFYPSNPELARQVWTYLEQMDDLFNDYKPGSEISRINAKESVGEVALSPWLAAAFGKARKAYDLSDGAFDISSAPIRNLWKQGARENRTPSDEEVAAAQQVCGLHRVQLKGDRLITERSGMRFDFGGIIKGIIADRVIEMLKEGGVKSALIQISGETAAYGDSPRKRPYRIAIQHPQDRHGSWCVVSSPSSEFSGSTSGNYEQPVIINGETFYHIFDVTTGRPVKTQVASVSIVFPQTGRNWMADSLSTAGVLLGPEKTFEMVEKLGGEVLFLVWEGRVLREIKSKGWDRFQL
jgi:thiamine biosynthesis lipoprotein